MKKYVIDELRPGEFDKLKKELDEKYGYGEIEGIYWIPLKQDLLDKIQIEHVDCMPYYFAIEIDDFSISCELLVRSKNKISCDCIRYANEKQRNEIINTIDSIFEKLKIIT